MMPHRVVARFLTGPFQVAVSAIAAVDGVLYSSALGFTLGWLQFVLWVMLGIGGAVALAGRLSDNPDGESAGLALLLGAYVFLSLTGRGIHDTVSAASYIVNAVGVTVAILARLFVVRKAARARRGATAKLRARRDDG